MFLVGLTLPVLRHLHSRYQQWCIEYYILFIWCGILCTPRTVLWTLLSGVRAIWQGLPHFLDIYRVIGMFLWCLYFELRPHGLYGYISLLKTWVLLGTWLFVARCLRPGDVLKKGVEVYNHNNHLHHNQKYFPLYVCWGHEIISTKMTHI